MPRPMPIKPIFVAALLLALTPLVWSRGASSETTNLPFLTRTRVGEHRKWTRVNPTPARIAALNAALCVAPPYAGLPSPHSDKYLTVYVNDIGKNAMLWQRHPMFPVGSVIIKEKNPRADGSAAELMTMMVKREKGFNPPGGDWEYAVVDGKAAFVQAQGRLATCQRCHLYQRGQDYIFRVAYLPSKARADLR